MVVKRILIVYILIHLFALFVNIYCLEGDIKIKDSKIKHIQNATKPLILKNGNKVTDYYIYTSTSDIETLTTYNERLRKLTYAQENGYINSVGDIMDYELSKDTIFDQSIVPDYNDKKLITQELNKLKLFQTKYVYFNGIFLGYNLKAFAFYLCLPFIIIIIIKHWTKK